MQLSALIRLTPEEFQAIVLSLKVALTAVGFSLPFGVWISWMLSKSRLPAKIWIENLINIPMVLPPVVTGYFLLVLLGQKGIIGGFLDQWFGVRIAFTWKGAAVASGAVAFPLMVQAIKVAMDGVDSRLEQAARLLRAGPFRVFFTITLPLSYRGIIAGALLSLARAFGEFGATIMLAGSIPGKTQTMPLAIFSLAHQTGRETAVTRLVVISIVISYLSLLCTSWFARPWWKKKNM